MILMEAFKRWSIPAVIALTMLGVIGMCMAETQESKKGLTFDFELDDLESLEDVSSGETDLSANKTNELIQCGSVTCPENRCRLINDSPVCVSSRERAILSCESDPCMNGGNCTSSIVGGFRCECPSGYAGEFCDDLVSKTPCVPSPCQGDCECIESCRHEDGRYCISQSGYIGRNCSIAVPFISCEPYEIMLFVLKDFYEEFDGNIKNSYIYVSPEFDGNINEDCVATKYGNQYVITIPLPFTSCGTTIFTTSDTYISFRNRLWINRLVDSRLYDMPVAIMDFECRYTKEYNIITKLQPVVIPELKTPLVTQHGNLNVQFELCKVPVCPLKCPITYLMQDEVVYTVGEMMHIGIHAALLTIPTLPPMVATIEEMYLSCNPDSRVSRVVDLVMNGCPVNPGFTMDVSSGSESFAQSSCVSFQMPRVVRCNSVYIHTRLRICESPSSTFCPGDRPVRRCVSRRKRSIDDLRFEELAVIGPIYIIEGKKGLKSYKVYPEDGGTRYVETPSGKINATIPSNGRKPINANRFWIFVVIGNVALLTILVMVVGFIAWRIQRSTPTDSFVQLQKFM